MQEQTAGGRLPHTRNPKPGAGIAFSGRSTTYHDGENEGYDVDGIGGAETSEDAEEQVVLGPRLRRSVGELILDVGLGAVLQSPLDVGACGESGHEAAARRAGGSESPAPRTGQAAPTAAPSQGSRPVRCDACRGGVCVYGGGSPQTPPLLPYVLTQQIQGGNTYKTKPSRVAARSGCGWLEARRGVPSCRCPTLQSVPQDMLLLLARQGPKPHGPWLLPRFSETLTGTVKRL